ncbi:MAG: FAD-dependent monooxygenase [Paracoccaceae bacterium]
MVIIGAGPIGLGLAIDLAQQDVPVVVLDDNDKVSFGSRAVCYAKRPLEILERLGCGRRMVEKGVEWNLGKVFFDQRQVYFNSPARGRPPLPGLHQSGSSTLSEHLVERAWFRRPRANRSSCAAATGQRPGHSSDPVRLEIETPEGPYELEAQWLVACDGANSPTRRMGWISSARCSRTTSSDRRRGDGGRFRPSAGSV